MAGGAAVGRDDRRVSHISALVDALNSLSMGVDGSLRVPTIQRHAVDALKALGLSSPLMPNEIERAFERAEVLLLPSNLLKAGLVVNDIEVLQRKLLGLYTLLCSADTRRQIEFVAGKVVSEGRPTAIDQLSLPRLKEIFDSISEPSASTKVKRAENTKAKTVETNQETTTKQTHAASAALFETAVPDTSVSTGRLQKIPEVVKYGAAVGLALGVSSYIFGADRVSASLFYWGGLVETYLIKPLQSLFW